MLSTKRIAHFQTDDFCAITKSLVSSVQFFSKYV